MKKKKNKTTGRPKRSKGDPPQDGEKVSGQQRADAKAKAKKRKAAVKNLIHIRQSPADLKAVKTFCMEFQEGVDAVDWGDLQL